MALFGFGLIEYGVNGTMYHRERDMGYELAFYVLLAFIIGFVVGALLATA
jgi:hypothetical protein